jgi:hypothetical protein
MGNELIAGLVVLGEGHAVSLCFALLWCGGEKEC